MRRPGRCPGLIQRHEQPLKRPQLRVAELLGAADDSQLILRRGPRAGDRDGEADVHGHLHGLVGHGLVGHGLVEAVSEPQPADRMGAVTAESGRGSAGPVLAGRVALVTGGGRGIGRAIALALADAGARVAVMARSGAEVAAVASEVTARYGAQRALAVTGDVAAGTDVLAAVAAAEAEIGPVDVLVNNAGVVWPLGRTSEVDPDAWGDSVAINLIGAFRCTHAVLPGMLARGYGRIVAITSGAARPPGMPSATAYSAAKAGLEMLTAGLALELAGTGVTVNALRPGVVDSAMQDYMRGRPRAAVGDGFYTRFHGLYERGDLIDPAVPAAVLVRLIASERTGEVLDVRAPESPIAPR